MLEIDELKNRFAGPFTFSVPRGRCAAIAGPSGSGKSLLLRMIGDFDPHEGRVRLDGRDRAAVPAPAWRAEVVHVAAEAGWWAERAMDHFAATTRDAAADLARRLGLGEDVLGRAIITLSTGERQRLALVRAIVAKPSVLLLDEPTSALDPDATSRAEALLRDLRDTGVIIVLVTHDASQANRLGDRLYRLRAGRLEPA